jgi:dihydroorotate dehydrogenase (fumarate)
MTLNGTFLGMSLKSPVMIASGPASHDVNQIALAEDHGAGAVVLKTVCAEKFAYMRQWPRPRYKLLDWDKQIGGRSKQFTLFAFEQGYSGTLEDYWKFIEESKKRAHIPIIGSAFADDAEDWADLAVNIERCGADAVELDISSPHRPGSLEFETTFVEGIKAVVAAVKIPVLVKLASTPDLVKQCMVSEQCGASAVTLCNRIRGIDIDIEEQKPILHGYYGGIGGPWAKYYTMRHVAEAAQNISIPISATGGTMTGEDAIKFILLGASTVQVLSAIMINGWETITAMNRDIELYMERKQIASLDEIRGKALRELTDPNEIHRWSGEPKTGARNVWKR